MTLFTDKILQFFHEDGWPLLEVDPGKTWQLTFKGTQGLWTCYAEIREEFFQFTFYSICPINVPEHKRAAVAELLTRVNSRLQLGNFEMDFDSGDLRYRTSLSLDGGAAVGDDRPRRPHAGLVERAHYRRRIRGAELPRLRAFRR